MRTQRRELSDIQSEDNPTPPVAVRARLAGARRSGLMIAPRPDRDTADRPVVQAPSDAVVHDGRDDDADEEGADKDAPERESATVEAYDRDSEQSLPE